MTRSWQEKLKNSKDLPKIVKVKGSAAKRWGGNTLYIPSPLIIDSVMKKVPKGKLITIDKIKEYLARKNKTDIACPLTTGIFAWISANAAEEQKADAKKTKKPLPKITPYWRTLKTGGILNDKYPGGIAAQKRLLEAEGHKLVRKGKYFVVANYEGNLVRL